MQPEWMFDLLLLSVFWSWVLKDLLILGKDRSVVYLKSGKVLNIKHKYGFFQIGILVGTIFQTASFVFKHVAVG